MGRRITKRAERIGVVATTSFCGWFVLGSTMPWTGLLAGAALGFAWVLIAKGWLPHGGPF